MARRIFWLTAVTGSLALVHPASAAPTRYEMNERGEFDGDSWQEFAGSSPTFSDGLLAVTYPEHIEWATFDSTVLPRGAWWSYVSAERGWWVEARISQETLPGSVGHGLGLEIYDGRNHLYLTLGDHDVLLRTPEETHYSFDTSNFHVYRVQLTSQQLVQVVIDGQQVLSVPIPADAPTYAGGVLKFGTIDEHMTGAFDYLAYDTAAPGTEDQDDDDDGIPLNRDLCPAVKDDGLDTDLDRLGDACDVCPNDRLDDVDGDGLCADEDLCPKNSQNPDANDNGVCDDDECAAGVPDGYEFAPEGSEGAFVCEVAGLQCGCYNRAAANCSPKSNCAAGCDCRYAGTAPASSASAVSSASSAATPPPPLETASSAATPPRDGEIDMPFINLGGSSASPEPGGNEAPEATPPALPGNNAPSASVTPGADVALAPPNLERTPTTPATSATSAAAADGNDTSTATCTLTSRRAARSSISPMFYIFGAMSLAALRRRSRRQPRA